MQNNLKEKKISIIVPVYNAELYLKECVESIINQNYHNIELILINDGSKDNSEKICINYANKDKRIKYIYQNNSGVSSARNAGLEIASGEYILFVDSDDFLEKNAISKLLKNITDVDLLCFGYNEVYIDKSIKVCFEKKINNCKEIEEKILLDNKIGGFLWNKIFKSKIIKNNNLKFNKEIHFCEDLLFVTEYIKYCKKTKYQNECLYNYRMRKNSASGNFFNKKSLSILYVYEILISKYKDNYKILSDLKYKYIINYYKLKVFIEDVENFKTHNTILAEEKKIMSTRSYKDRNKVFIIKNFNFIFKYYHKKKMKKQKLYE